MAKNTGKSSKAETVVPPDPYHRSIMVGNTEVKLVLSYPQYQKTVAELFSMLDANKPQDKMTMENILHNARWIPESLPEPLWETGKFFMGRPLPKFAIVGELWAKVKAQNPTDHSREGNAHQIQFANGGQTSIGSFTLMCLGLHQQHVGPDFGINGTYHPKAVLEELATVPDYKLIINSPSPLYDKARRLYAARLAQEEIAKAASTAAAQAATAKLPKKDKTYKVARKVSRK